MDIKHCAHCMGAIASGDKIIIWGGGIRGLRLLRLLLKWGANVYAFGDNDEEKQKQGIQGFPCYSKAQLLELDAKEDLYIIVSVFNNENLYGELSDAFSWVFPYDIYDIIYSAMRLDEYTGFIPIGHYYSLYPDLSEIEAQNEIIYDSKKQILDIELNEGEQVYLLERLGEMYSTVPDWVDIESENESKFRYRYHNPAFPPADSITLHCMLRYIKPKRMIEVGSGWSSAVSLDTNEYYLNNAVDITFIEPYADRLKSTLKDSDSIHLIEKKLQEVSYSVFESLEAGDMLFVDSTHVSKVGSDVNYMFFEIFPRLKKGVYIHLHDIFHLFEYPKDWAFNGRAWNELYLLRAFLQNNEQYKIVYFQNMLEKMYGHIISEYWNLNDSFHGGSFYMVKI